MLFPIQEPLEQDYLRVSPLHEIFFYRYGNPKGIPLVFLHGGPGGGIDPDYHRLFDPQKYHVILFDQRGCGKSRPFSELRENDTWSLVEDIESLRKKFAIEKWVVFGGSWGACLALAYASRYPESILKLFLRGIFTLRRSELQWFYQEGASWVFPEAWQSYCTPIPAAEHKDFLTAYYKRLTGDDQAQRRTCAKAWSVWEASTSKLFVDPSHVEKCAGDEFADAFARIEAHYFYHKGFFPSEDYLLESVKNFAHLPALIVQGRYDMVCPAKTAYELHQAWPESELKIIPDAGHSLMEPGILKCLMQALQEYQI